MINIIPIYDENNNKIIKKFIGFSLILEVNKVNNIINEMMILDSRFFNYRIKNELNINFDITPKEDIINLFFNKLNIKFIIFGNYPIIEDSFEISMVKNDNEFLNQRKYIDKKINKVNNKYLINYDKILEYIQKQRYNFRYSKQKKKYVLNQDSIYFNNHILLYSFENAYLISLKNREIISIFQITTNELVNYYSNKKYYEDYSNIIISDNSKELDDIDYSKFEKRVFEENNLEYNNAKRLQFNLLFINYDKQKYNENLFINRNKTIEKIDNRYKDEEINFISYDESRIIRIKRLSINLEKNNKIVINNKNKNFEFNSIVKSSIYKLIFPSFINEIDKNYIE